MADKIKRIVIARTGNEGKAGRTEIVTEVVISKDGSRIEERVEGGFHVDHSKGGSGERANRGIN